MSIPIEAGPFSAMRSKSSAMRVRGQGHCPYLSSAFSSITTIATGLVVRSSGKSRW